MTAPPTLPLTPRAKTYLAIAAAVILAGITAWQQVTRDGFTWVDVVPVAAAVVGAIATDLIPNTGNQPAAKAIVHGAAMILAAVSTVVAQDPAGMTAAKLLTAAAGAFLVWFVGELNPASSSGSTAPLVVRVAADVGSLSAGKLTAAGALQAVKTAAADVAASMGPDLDLAATQPFPAVTAAGDEPTPAPTPRLPAA